MKYDFENMILFNEHGVYYKIHAYKDDAVYIKSIKKPVDIEKCKLMSVEELFKNRIDIMYIGTKSNIPEGKLK